MGLQSAPDTPELSTGKLQEKKGCKGNGEIERNLRDIARFFKVGETEPWCPRDTHWVTYSGMTRGDGHIAQESGHFVQRGEVATGKMAMVSEAVPVPGVVYKGVCLKTTH